MRNIRLICTVHEEKGLCSISRLYQLIETARPEVIFLELPQSLMSRYFEDKSDSNLETTAVIRYIENHEGELVPADVFAIPEDFFEMNGRLHRRIEANSSEYRRLMDWHSQYLRRYGFEYLNSDYCSNLWADIHTAMEEILVRLDDAQLTKTYQSWNDVIEQRDQTMIANIYAYSQEHEFSSGVFLVGAAHRRSIIQKIESISKVASVNVKWSYRDYQGLL